MRENKQQLQIFRNLLLFIIIALFGVLPFAQSGEAAVDTGDFLLADTAGDRFAAESMTFTFFGSTGSVGGTLIGIDPNTGAGTPIGPHGVFGPVTDIDTRDDGVMFGSTGAGTANIIEICPIDSFETLVGSYGSGAVNALEFVGSTLYGAYIPGPGNPSVLVTIDQSSGAITPIGSSIGFTVSGLAYNPNTATMYGVTTGGPSLLLTINLATGLGTPVGPTGFSNVSALEFDTTTWVLYGGVGNNSPTPGVLITINPATGAGLLVGLTGFPGVSGLTFFSDYTDTDGDGDIDACDADDDNDGVPDGVDADPLDPNVCEDSDGDSCDDCVIGTDDFGPDPDNTPFNDGVDTDSDGLCDDGDTDDDNDGVPDGVDTALLDPDVCGDSDGDTCEDCSIGTDDFGPLSDSLTDNDGVDTDSDGLCDDGDTDDDNDGVPDGVDTAPLDPNICADADGDTCDDCAVGVDQFGPLADNDPANDGTDVDGDGICVLTDCDDNDPNNYPGNTEACDGQDNDCDPATEDGADAGWLGLDCDGDDTDKCNEGVYICDQGLKVCTDTTGDNIEICDGLDNDCAPNTKDGADEAWLGAPCDGNDTDLCNEGVYECTWQGQKCTDSTGDNLDICDGNDNDCNAGTPDGFDEIWYGLACDGDDADLCNEGTFVCLNLVQTCSDTTGDNAELCDGVDNDCDENTSDGADEDWLGAACDGSDSDLCEEGVYECTGGGQKCTDVTGDNLDVCDGNDNDCNAGTPDGSDELWIGSACDGNDTDLCDEGVFECTGGSQTCSDTTGDNAEVCDLADNDCDGETDEDPQTLTTTLIPVDGGFLTPDCSDPGCQYSCFDEVNLVAVASPGNAFDSWSVCDSASGRFCSLVMDDSIDTTANFAACTDSFHDVTPGFWAEDAIMLAACNDVVFGCEPDTYCNSGDVTRAHMPVFIARSVVGEPSEECATDPFPDVPASFWACKYIQWALDNGIVSGFPDGEYKSGLIVNRGQMAAFIIQGLIASGVLPGEPDECVSDPFPDVPSSHIFCKYISKLVELGIASGFADGTFRPDFLVNRAQMAVFVARAFLGL